MDMYRKGVQPTECVQHKTAKSVDNVKNGTRLATIAYKKQLRNHFKTASENSGCVGLAMCVEKMTHAYLRTGSGRMGYLGM